MAKIGIIAGSGIYEMQGLELVKEVPIETPYGSPSDKYRIFTLSGNEIIFLSRHGQKHTISPHMVNYRANIWGFKELGAERILAIGASGGIKKGLRPGDIVILDQVIDMTEKRHSTFYDGKDIVHIDFTEPYCPELREAYIESSKDLDISVHKSGTYICTEGPRLESRAEIEFFSRMGGDVVGMTGMPEASLARELELCYCSVAVVTNYAAGVVDKKLTVKEVLDKMRETSYKLNSLISRAISFIPEERSCPCKDVLKEARI